MTERQMLRFFKAFCWRPGIYKGWVDGSEGYSFELEGESGFVFYTGILGDKEEAENFVEAFEYIKQLLLRREKELDPDCVYLKDFKFKGDEKDST